MSIEQGDVAAWKALPIFSTMRSNLALADAFLRHPQLRQPTSLTRNWASSVWNLVKHR